jgi:hypothetical protein
MCLTSCIIRQLTGEKVTNKCIEIVYLFLKCIYLFIYRTDMFLLFPSHHQGASCMVQRRNNVCIFQYTIIYISVLQLQFTLLQIEDLKYFIV